MIKLFLIGGGVFLLLVLVGWVLLIRSRKDLPSAFGTTADLERYLDLLAKATAPEAFLIVGFPESDDFVQFKHYEGIFEIDFPIFTERQRSLEDRIRQVRKHLGLTIRVTEEGKDGHFIDFDYAGQATEMAEIVGQLLIDVFEAPQGADLIFSWSVIEPMAS